MTNYYGNKHRANKFIAEKIEDLVRGKIESGIISVPELALKTTDLIPVGEKVVYDRVKLHVRVNKNLRLVDDDLFYVGDS